MLAKDTHLHTQEMNYCWHRSLVARSSNGPSAGKTHTFTKAASTWTWWRNLTSVDCVPFGLGMGDAVHEGKTYTWPDMANGFQPKKPCLARIHLSVKAHASSPSAIKFSSTCLVLAPAYQFSALTQFHCKIVSQILQRPEAPCTDTPDMYIWRHVLLASRLSPALTSDSEWWCTVACCRPPHLENIRLLCVVAGCAHAHAVRTGTHRTTT